MTDSVSNDLAGMIAAWTHPLPTPWAGGEPRFPIDARFHLAALRAELAWMLDSAVRFQTLAGSTPPIDDPALADETHDHAEKFLRHVDGLTQFLGCGLHDLDNHLRVPDSPDAAIVLWRIRQIVCGWSREGGRSPLDCARYISDPSRLATMAALYDYLPVFEFDPPPG